MIHRRWAFVGLLALTVVLGGCSTTQRTSCESVTEETVSRFVEAIDSGDVAAAVGLFATDFDTFFDQGGDFEANASDREALGSYLSNKVAAGMSYALATFDYNGEAGSGLGNFGLTIRDGDDDFIHGKGAVRCADGSVVFLGLGEPE